MTKNLYIAILFMLLTSCGQVNREIKYISDAKSATEGFQWTNCDVSLSWDSINGLTKPYSFTVISHPDKDNPFFAIIEKELLHSILVKEKEVLVVDERTRELSRFSNYGKNESVWFEQMRYEAFSTLEYLSFYTIPFSIQTNYLRWIPKIQKITDTTIQGVLYRKFVAIHEKRREFNNETKEFDIPLQYISHIWLNQKTNQFDSVTVFQVTNNHNREIRHYHIMNLNHDDKSSFIDTIFDFDKPDYIGYSKHTESFPPNSRIATHNEDTNDSLLNFPFIGLQHDTTTIIKTKGWVLLDLWQFGCPACYQGFTKLQHERDSLSYGILEHEGITIIAANAKSNNFDIIKEISEKCGCPDILYAGKGTMSILALVNHAFPSYYLISPEKDIIWRSNYLDDYSELLEAKANYEKQRQN